MNYTFSDEYTWIPVANGNLEDEAPTEFQLKYMTLPERVDCMVVDFLSVDGTTQRRTSFNEAKILKYSIVSIKNLSVNGEEIKTVAQLLAVRRLASLCSLLADYCAGKNNTTDLKN